jgi:hypothetical protein
MTKMCDTEGTLTFVVQVEKEYDTYKVMARICRVTDQGEVLNTQWQYGGWDLGAEYAGFHLMAYAGPGWSSGPALDSEKGIWGQGTYYDPSRIESAKQANAIAKVFTRIERGLEKLNAEDGYLPHDDFAAYLLRIAKILKIKEIRVRNTKRAQEMTGETYKVVNGSGLQYWVSDVDRTIKDGKRAELVRR